MKLVPIVLAAFIGATAPAVAFACSCSQVDPFFPTNNGVVPAEQGGLMLIGGYYDESSPVGIERDVDGAWESVASSVELFDGAGRVVFDNPPGVYRLLQVPVGGGDAEEVMQFEVQEIGEVSGDLVAEFGDLEMVTRSFGSSSCSTDARAAERSLSYALPAELQPFGEALHIELLRDGEAVYYGDSTCDFSRREGTPPLPPTIFGACNSSEIDRGYEAGEYTFSVRASLPGTDYSWSSEPQVVDLECRGVGGCATTAPSPNVWGMLGLLLVATRLRRAGRGRHEGAESRA